MEVPPPEEVGNEVIVTTHTTDSGDAEAAAAATTTTTTTEAADAASVATLSSPWQFDELQTTCAGCRGEFSPLNRRHHCRLCGKIFCNNCTHQRALIPPSSIVLTPKGGKKAKPRSALEDSITFSPDEDPDRMLTYLSAGENKELLYGKGLEERFKLAREPLRVCPPCYQQLAPLQPDLRNSNSNAMRFNYIDPTDPRRLFNSPLAFTLGHEIRKAAFTLNNLLPQPKRMGAVMASSTSTSNYNNNNNDFNYYNNTSSNEQLQHCKETCSSVSPNLGDLDGVRIPARLLEQAKGLAVMTVVKGGFGLAGVEFGTGLVVARLDDNNTNTNTSNRWSAPSAIGTAGLSWGALIGAQVSDHVFLLMNYDAVEMLFNDKGSVQLGADVGVAVGPLGRALEADLGAAPGKVAPIYTYSLSKGLYAGISLDGKVIGTREYVNEKFYGRRVSAREILAGAVPTPPAASPLYEALQRCHVYATGNIGGGGMHRNHAPFPVRPSPDVAVMGEYGEMMAQQQQQQPSPLQHHQQQQQQTMMMPPAAADQHSYAGMSDLTDPGY